MDNETNNDATGRIYLVVPVKYRCTYNRLLTALSDFGIDALKDCDSVCKGSKGQIIKCWNMFQAAMAAYNLGNEREADVLVKYIDAQLNIIYKDGAPSEDCPNITCCDYQVVLELLKSEFKDLVLEALNEFKPQIKEIVLEALAEYFGPTPPTPTTKYLVTVNVTPSNANVTINGQNTRTLEVDEGSDVVINASLTGYISQTRTINNISQNETVNIVLEETPSENYTLTVNPSPNTANVTLNGQSGRSIIVPDGTSVRVIVSASGYQTYDETIVVNADRTLNVTLNPVPTETYTVTVIPTPSDATVQINGQNTTSLQVPGGSNVSVYVYKGGYQSYENTINNISQNETLNVVLEENPPSPTPVYEFSVNGSTSDTSVPVVAAGDTKTINYISRVTESGITSDVPVSVSLDNPSDSSWVHITQNSGNISVVVDANAAFSPRSADINFVQQGTNTTIVVTIAQSAAEEQLEVYDDNGITPIRTINFNSLGGTKTIIVSSNTNWEIV